MKIIGTILFGMIYLTGSTQVANQLQPITSITASAYNNNKRDAFAATNLIAASAFLDTLEVGVYSENRFMIKGLYTLNCAIGLPVKNGGIGISGHYIGLNGFSILGISGGHGLMLTKDLGIGIKVESSWISILQREKITRLGYQAGLVYRLSDKTSFGFHFSNNRFLKSNEIFIRPGNYSINTGIGHQLNKSIYVACEVTKENDKTTSIAPHIKWDLNNISFIQGGIMPPANIGYIGIGWHKKKDILTMIFSSHPYLGYSGALSIIHEIK